jgi:hypothetical protein
VGGFGRRKDFFDGYQSVTGESLDEEAVKFWQVFGSFWWAVGCLGMAEHYRNGPDQSVERPGIGRRSSECQVDCVNLLIPGAVALTEPSENSDLVDMPRADELLTSVADFLREQVMSETVGRTQFLARVAGNSLDIVQREMALGLPLEAEERARLQALLDMTDNDLVALRWALVTRLRQGDIALDTPALTAHLRTTVVNQINIDQPRYPGLATALAGGGDE